MLTVYNSVFCSYVQSLKAVYFAKYAESVSQVLSDRAIEVLLSFVNGRKKIRTFIAISKSIGIFSLFAGGPFGFEKNESILFRKTRVQSQGTRLKCFNA